MNTKQFTILITAITIILCTGFYFMMPSKTPEQIVAETQKTIELQKLEQLKLDANYQRQLQSEKVKAEIQAAKPVQVQVAESETSLGEAAMGVAVIGGGIYVFSKLLDVVSE